jgi:D-glycero-D-manno-heptose 1,7-bisphosphate phosphatase
MQIRKFNDVKPNMPLVILDRDNTLTVDEGYTHLVTNFQWMPGAREFLSEIYSHGINVAIATNQSGIGRGYYTVPEVDLFHDYLVAEADSAGVKISTIAYCPHYFEIESQGHCSCRKPAPGMLLEIVKLLGPSKTVMIGDKGSDLEAAEAAGIPGLLTTKETPLKSLADKVVTLCM